MSKKGTYSNLSQFSLATLRQRWGEVDEQDTFRKEWMVTLIFGVLIIWFLPDYFAHIQTRPGLEVFEPLLPLIPSMDVSIYINLLLYSSVIIAIFHLMFHPRMLLRACQTYVFMTFFRTISIYLIPMVPPEGLVYLNDPFLNNMLYRGYVTKDLFFSGHTATLFLVGYLAVNAKLKAYFYVVMVVLGGLILVQHMHYTIDVVAAPIFVIISYKMVLYLEEKFQHYYEMSS